MRKASCELNCVHLKTAVEKLTHEQRHLTLTRVWSNHVTLKSTELVYLWQTRNKLT